MMPETLVTNILFKLAKSLFLVNHFSVSAIIFCRQNTFDSLLSISKCTPYHIKLCKYYLPKSSSIDELIPNIDEVTQNIP